MDSQKLIEMAKKLCGHALSKSSDEDEEEDSLLEEDDEDVEVEEMSPLNIIEQYGGDFVISAIANELHDADIKGSINVYEGTIDITVMIVITDEDSSKGITVSQSEDVFDWESLSKFIDSVLEEADELFSASEEKATFFDL